MAIVNGNNLRVYAIDGDGTGTRIQLAHSQTVSLDISNSLIDITTKDSNSWTERLSGQRTFSLSTDGLLDYDTTGTHDVEALADFAIAGTELHFSFGVTENGTLSTGDVVYTGSGFVSSFGQSGGTDDAPTYSLALDGNGALTKTTQA